MGLSRGSAGKLIASARGDVVMARCRWRLAVQERCGSAYRLDRDHPEGVHLAVLVADRDIFAGAKDVVAEPIAGLIVLVGRLVIIEQPAAMAGAARPMHQPTDPVVLALPEPPHATMLAAFAPQPRIDMAVGGERGHD